MFSYALYHVLCKNNNYGLAYIDIIDSSSHHNGFELDKVFPVIKRKNDRVLKGFSRKLYSKYLNRLFKHYKQSEVGFFEHILSTRHALSSYDGFWQSERYFLKESEDITNLFAFNRDRISRKTREVSIDIAACSSVSIHVRRGDYLGNTQLNSVCSLSYYKEAIRLISRKVANPVFYLFTDDKDWVKSQFSDTNFILVDWNETTDSWQDMFLMSQCRHNIIANSTFSWWGAWLNKYDRKCVIAPKRWFANAEAPDIIPDTWIRV